ncbi:MAG: proline dehydrogenase family protein [Flavobacteriaceae bacterium]
MLFEDTQTAFVLKSDADLDRAYFLFRLIANEPLVRIGTTVTNFALKSHLPIEGLVRATVFDHFCSGTTAEESLSVVDKLASQGVASILDYSVEGDKSEIDLDTCLAKTLETFDYSKQNPDLPFGVFKPSGIGRFGLYEKISAKQPLTAAEEAEWQRVENRYRQLCDRAVSLGIRLLIDAEESWIQPAIDELIEKLMAQYNRNEVVVFNTLQMYRHDRLDYLKTLHQRATKQGFKVGVKLVRGAYLEKENQRAKQHNYPSPLCKSKSDTDKNFDAALVYVFDHLEDIALFFGSHNEASAYAILDLIAAKGLDQKHPHIWFGQLYGMSDHISFNLAKAGYQVAKYLPFGPVRDVMPYLIRRAEENTSVVGQTTRELDLISKERKRRKINGDSSAVS